MKKHSLDNYSTRALAVEFVERLRSCLLDEDIVEIKRRNATPEYKNACASHDFIDANMVMNDAFEKIVGRELDAENGFECVFWSEAWDIAKREFLTAENTPEYDRGFKDGRASLLLEAELLAATLRGISEALDFQGGFEPTVGLIKARLAKWEVSLQ